MLHVKGSPASFVGNPLLLGAEPELIDWRWMMSAIRRRLGTIIKLTLVCAGLAAVYVVLRPAVYTAHTHLLLTNLKLTFSRDDALFAESLPDPSFLETQMQIMRSEKIALSVVDRLRLNEAEQPDSEGVLQRLRATAVAQVTSLLSRETAREGEESGPLTDILRSVAGYLTPAMAAAEQGEGEARRDAMRRLQSDTSIERVGMSNIVMVRYTAADPEQAAQVANEMARAYVDDQVAARIEAAQSASIWMRERLRDVGPKTRIIAQAASPSEKSNPRGLLIIAIAAFAGCGFGISFALLRQMLDLTVQSPELVVKATGVEFLGVVPLLRGWRFKQWRMPLRRDGATVLRTPPITAYASTHPLSTVGQTLNHAKVVIDGVLGSQTPRLIGVTATFAGEGSSTIAANLAHVIAARGERVLLIDGNRVDGSLSSTLLRRPREGLIACLAAGPDALQDHVQVDPADGMHFLPIGHTSKRGTVPPIWTEAMQGLLKAAADSYDYVVCDLAPLSSVAEVRAAARYLGGILLVVGWRQVEAEHLRVGVLSAGIVRDKIFGAVLNKVDVQALRRTGSPTGAFLWRATGRAGARG
ncbi:hypothetical protein G3T14_15300 [Methylobacterium sp. BTF04]|uniref:Wzz/FepE/Etk N-terminal domain-containing protein n=1 Tax=Methylobacterium sp. BTF04 TaxID=2708300 RepID=UPI0013D1019C|nr:Wzz/FepE/Etk N-terminal domain-containing protein [Methylobacterium sp. BTF04]NEU13488.1 hypothetical protein [Methylobacterium sp. BTF04]